MQNDRYKAEPKTAVCVWCFTEYRCCESHARYQGSFCSKRCEIEARFWLYNNLKAPPITDNESA